MYGAASPTLTDRFAWLIDGLCKAIGVDAQKRRMDAALAWAVWNRVRVLGARLVALMVRARSGRVTRQTARRKGTPHPGPLLQGEREKSAGVAAGDVSAALPREFGWVRRALPETARFAGVLAYFLDDPEIAALVAKTPEAGRILRPLCHLLGVQPPEFLRRGAVVAQPAAVIAAEAPRTEPAPPLSEREPPPSAPAADTSATNGAAVTPPAEDAALAHARRPGGLYWDGTRHRWS